MDRRRHNYKNLKVWKQGLIIVNETYELLDRFPKSERFELSSQISRCSVSIPSNIAEGSARTNKSFSHFIDIALGSSFELSTQLIIAKNRGYINEKELTHIEEKIEEFQKMAMGFQNKL